MAKQAALIYWDASAIVSALFQDSHSDTAVGYRQRMGVHMVSTLAWAEVHAVVARMEREQVITETQAAASREVLVLGPWRLVHAQPSAELISELATRRALRGADLWHLALAKTLQAELPELVLLSFDKQLNSAATDEKLALA